MNIDTRARRAAQGIHRAVEEMEMTTQTETPRKIERLDRFRERRQRYRRIGATAVAVAVVAVAVVVGVATIDRSRPLTTGRIGPSEAREVLDLVIPAPDEPPQGMEIYTQLDGGEALSRPFGGPAPDWASLGLVDARANDFVNRAGPSGAVNTWAGVYQSPDAADVALSRWTQHLEEAFSDAGTPLDLGEAGFRYTAATAVRWEACQPAVGFIWRSGPVILQILACEEPGIARADDVAARMAAGVEAVEVGRPDRVTTDEANRLLDAVLLHEGDLQHTVPMSVTTDREALGAPFDQGLAETWALEGFVQARLNAYGVPGPGERGFLGSWGAVYESEAAAAVVLARYADVFTAPPPYGFGFSEAEELPAYGDGGWRYGGASGERIGVSRECRTAKAYLWRSGPMILHVLACRPAHIAVIDEAVTTMRLGVENGTDFRA